MSLQTHGGQILVERKLSTKPVALARSTRIFIWGGVHLVQFEPEFFHALESTCVVAPTEWLNVENTPTLLHLTFVSFYFKSHSSSL